LFDCLIGDMFTRKKNIERMRFMIVDMKLKLHDTWITSHKGENKERSTGGTHKSIRNVKI